MTRTSTTGYKGGPHIVYAAGGNWRPLYGHNCGTLAQAESYCDKFGFTIVYDGEPLPPCPDEAPKPDEPIVISEATKVRLREIASSLRDNTARKSGQ